MARITVDDCLTRVDNRFELVHVAASRVRQLRQGAKPLSGRKNKDVVISLREIAAGEITAANVSEHDIRLRHQDELMIEALDDGAYLD
jgi:DNA-directed RNA polymerase subunit omega